MVYVKKYATYTVSEFYCTYCGQKGIPIARRAGKQRETGHLKKLYCPNCGLTLNHAEIRPFGQYRYENFKEEFDLGRFVNGNRINLDRLDQCNLKCKYNKNGKCWNANHSFSCERDEERSDFYE